VIKILFLISFSAFLFFFAYFFIYKINVKTKIKKKESSDFKSLIFGKRKIFISLFIFLICVILTRNIIFAVILCVLYIYFDWYIKDKNRRKHISLMDKQVIEALGVVKNAIQAGQSLQNAINTAQNELKNPIRLEFEKISDKLALGISFDRILKDVSQNTKSKEFKFMIDTIRVSKDTGASLSGIFERMTDAISQRIAIQSKMSVLTAQSRMSGNVVSIMPFVVVFMIYLIEPSMMESLFVTFIGNILLLIVVVMVLAGSFVIRKMTEINL